MQIPENCILTIFGASGDLTARKLIPAVFDLYKQNLIPQNFAILGTARTELSDETFRQKMVDSVQRFGTYKADDREKLAQFVENLHYVSMDPSCIDHYGRLGIRLLDLEGQYRTNGRCIFYLATPPSLYATIPEFLMQHGLTNQEKGWKRVVVEKPFGYDLESARNLNASLLHSLSEEQIFRIDHYLGKETVQNVLVTRFANGIFEPLWNRNYIHHVEITAVENIGVESRGGYYENAGALRDMVQNHLLQLVALIAMEPPSSFASNAIRNERIKVFESLRPIPVQDVEKYVIRGQYTSSVIKGSKVPGYREEHGVDPNSRTETYIALKFYIDNWRWGGVPFYIRTGKRMPTRVTEVVIHFKPTPHYLFSNGQDVGDSCNQLVIRIQPDEGILLKFGMKIPGSGFEVQKANMEFHYSHLTNVYIPSAYERLLLDCMLGDSTLYTRGDSAESCWKFLAPIQNAWKENPEIKVFGYPAGSWGPENADTLFHDQGITWRYPCKNLANDGLYCEL